MIKNQNYPCLIRKDVSKIVISGNCPHVKQEIIQDRLQKARKKNLAVIVLDFGRKGSFSQFLKDNGYYAQHIFTAKNDNYKLISAESLKQEVFSIRSHAIEMGYSHQEYGTMVSFLNFLLGLEEQCNSVSPSIAKLLDKFKNQEKFEDFLAIQVKNKKIQRKQAKDYIQTYLEYVHAGITADVLISEQNFILSQNQGNDFTLSALKSGEAAIIYADKNNSSNGINDYLCRALTNDIIKLSENLNLLIIANTAQYSQVKRLYEMAESFSHDSQTELIYCANDLFSGVPYEYAESFTKFFEIALYGQHIDSSAEYVSRKFGSHWIPQYSYTTATNPYVYGEYFIDQLLGTDYTITNSVSNVKERIFTPERIMKMFSNEYIVHDMINGAVCLTSI